MIVFARDDLTLHSTEQGIKTWTDNEEEDDIDDGIKQQQGQSKRE
jgi:hypothetical protein